MLGRGLQILFFCLIVKPVLLIILGVRVKGHENLPENGPAILIANHNSHLDTLVLMNMYSLRNLRKLRPVAAADYFMKTPLRAWLSTNVINIIPIARKGARTSDPLEPIYDALDNNQIVIFYPEGTRGEPEKIADFKRGISILCEKYPDVPVAPILTFGLGKALPKGDPVIVPFFVDVIVDKPCKFKDCKTDDFSEFLEQKLKTLKGGQYFADYIEDNPLVDV